MSKIKRDNIISCLFYRWILWQKELGTLELNHIYKFHINLSDITTIDCNLFIMKSTIIYWGNIPAFIWRGKMSAKPNIKKNEMVSTKGGGALAQVWMLNSTKMNKWSSSVSVLNNSLVRGGGVFVVFSSLFVSVERYILWKVHVHCLNIMMQTIITVVIGCRTRRRGVPCMQQLTVGSGRLLICCYSMGPGWTPRIINGWHLYTEPAVPSLR